MTNGGAEEDGLAEDTGYLEVGIENNRAKLRVKLLHGSHEYGVVSGSLVDTEGWNSVKIEA